MMSLLVLWLWSSIRRNRIIYSMTVEFVKELHNLTVQLPATAQDVNSAHICTVLDKRSESRR